MVCCAVVPFAALLAAAEVTTNMWVPRYLLATLPAWTMLAAVTLGNRGLVPVALTITTTVVLLGLPAQQAVRNSAGHGQASRSVAEIIGANQRPTDGLIFADTHPSIPWAARDIVARYLPPNRTPRDVLAVAPQRTDGRLLAKECADLAARLADTPRLWLLRVDNPDDLLSQMGDRKRALLKEHYHVVQTWRQPLITIVLMERNKDAAPIR